MIEARCQRFAVRCSKETLLSAPGGTRIRMFADDRLGVATVPRKPAISSRPRIVSKIRKFGPLFTCSLGLHGCLLPCRSFAVSRFVRRALCRLRRSVSHLPSLLDSRNLPPDAIALVLAAATARKEPSHAQDVFYEHAARQ